MTVGHSIQGNGKDGCYNFNNDDIISLEFVVLILS